MNVSGQTIFKEYLIQKKYLNLPVDMKHERQLVHFLSAGDTMTYSVIRIADGEPDYWVFKDVSAWEGKKLRLVFSKCVQGIDQIYQSDRFAGEDSLYKETSRPQFHFSSRRGWNNDPNKEWVIALYKTAGISFFKSRNLKSWKEESHINGFYECPELFPHPDPKAAIV